MVINRKLYIDFLIDTTGTVSKAKILHGTYFAFNRERYCEPEKIEDYNYIPKETKPCFECIMPGILKCSFKAIANVPLHKEAIRLVLDMPKWKPGYQDGKPVNVIYTIPLKFSLK